MLCVCSSQEEEEANVGLEQIIKEISHCAATTGDAVGGGGGGGVCWMDSR